MVFPGILLCAILKDALDPADEISEVLNLGGGLKLDEVHCFLLDVLFELFFLLVIQLQEHLLDLDGFLVRANAYMVVSFGVNIKNLLQEFIRENSSRLINMNRLYLNGQLQC